MPPTIKPVDPREELASALTHGLGATAAISIASPLGVTGVRLWLVAMPFIGAAIAQFGPVHRLAQSQS